MKGSRQESFDGEIFHFQFFETTEKAERDGIDDSITMKIAYGSGAE